MEIGDCANMEFKAEMASVLPLFQKLVAFHISHFGEVNENFNCVLYVVLFALGV